MIDLSTCVPNQKVKYRNSEIGAFVGLNGKGEGFFPFLAKTKTGVIQTHTRNGKLFLSVYDYPHDIVEILPLEPPVIDLSTCVPGQKVRFQNGQIGFVSTSRRRSGNTEMQGVGGNSTWSWYTLDGIQGKDLPDPEWRIVEILPVETPKEQPTPTPQEMDYKSAYIEIANIISVAFPECEVTTVDMARLLIHENRTLRMALGLPTYEQVDSLTCTETRE